MGTFPPNEAGLDATDVPKEFKVAFIFMAGPEDIDVPTGSSCV